MGINIAALFKSYKNGDQITEVLQDVTFQVEDGEFLAIIGPSGSGKSTYCAGKCGTSRAI